LLRNIESNEDIGDIVIEEEEAVVEDQFIIEDTLKKDFIESGEESEKNLKI
jgi:hypothetical protein